MMAAFIVNANIESLALGFAEALRCRVKKRNFMPIDSMIVFFRNEAASSRGYIFLSLR